ncbi:ribonuclease E/G [Phenylobacterium aquaticum]|uniref:ribonuclease E/G n=1 Tax=Phenylobacterium aquaticum TaxID=1763816 RepID=UPI0026EB0682|nr:ribonuclease E/G [Phenylobacterium aquaticum]
MSERRLFLDRGIGENRGVVLLDGKPERLLIERDDTPPAARLGARLAARVRKVEPAFASAFLDIGDGLEALLSFKPEARPVEGQMLEVELRTEARAGKLATVRALGSSDGKPRLLAAAPDLAEQLTAFAREGRVVEGREARQIADRAEIEALETVHALAGGGDIAIEQTRALVAIDVDLGERKGQDAKRLTRQANIAALGLAARLLRLKGLGGIVVIDLVGRGHDATALMTAARTAFAPDNPGVSIGPVGRLGTMELSIPRRGRAVREILLDAHGEATDQTVALRLIRAIQTEAQVHGGARLTAACAPRIASLAKPFAEALAGQIGVRFTITPDPAMPRDRFEVRIA